MLELMAFRSDADLFTISSWSGYFDDDSEILVDEIGDFDSDAFILWGGWEFDEDMDMGEWDPDLLV